MTNLLKQSFDQKLGPGPLGHLRQITITSWCLLKLVTVKVVWIWTEKLGGIFLLLNSFCNKMSNCNDRAKIAITDLTKRENVSHDGYF